MTRGLSKRMLRMTIALVILLVIATPAVLAFTGLFTWLVSLLGKSAGVPMGFPPFWIALVAILLLVISLASGVLSLGVLKKSQPADLLR